MRTPKELFPDLIDPKPEMDFEFQVQLHQETIELLQDQLQEWVNTEPETPEVLALAIQDVTDSSSATVALGVLLELQGQGRLDESKWNDRERLEVFHQLRLSHEWLEEYKQVTSSLFRQSVNTLAHAFPRSPFSRRRPKR